MKFSVVIPTYNEEKYLPKALESITNQTIKPYEIIIVDSQSTDKTREIARAYGAKVITIKERGIGLARNIGAKHAKGDVIVCTSADVVVDRHWLEELGKALNHAELAYGSIYLQEADWVERAFELILNKCLTPLLSLLGLVFATCDNIAIKKSLYEKIGGINEKLNTGEDTDLVKRARKAGRVVYVEKARVYTSPRRIKKWGKLKYFWFHFKNFLTANLLGKTAKEYEPVRE